MNPRDAFLRACALDVDVRKPGNVSRASPGHGMDAAQFLASAQAAAPALCEPGARVGDRIEGAVRATLAAAGCNTNLGIVLLCAPLATAAERGPRHALRAALVEVLDALDLDDARAAFRAIALANPGGLGRVDAADVHEPPCVSLREAMGLAADRDRIARQYVSGFAELFDIGLPLLRSAPLPAGVQRAFLGFLASGPDSHIVRKYDATLAQAVTRDAATWLERSRSGAALDDDPAFAAWDEDLKRAAINPGTSADLTVATAMLDGLLAQG